MNDAAYILTKAAIAYKNGEEYAQTFDQAVYTIFWEWVESNGQSPETRKVLNDLESDGFTLIR